jgi:pimeloyl-ACP methyl ester carboxylesterase
MIPRLLDAGYEILAIDQRAGGARLGGTNRTLGDLKLKREYTYCEAYPDLQAALAYAQKLDDHGPLVVWGSSYSAALVLKLAAEHGEALAGVLAFSPASGDPLKGCDPTETAESVDVPTLALRPASEMEHEAVAKQLEWLKELGFETYVADPGVHGSSMLNPSRVEGNVEPTWKVVLAFLEKVTKPQR